MALRLIARIAGLGMDDDCSTISPVASTFCWSKRHRQLSLRFVFKETTVQPCPVRRPCARLIVGVRFPAMSHFRFPETRFGMTRKIECGLDVYITVNAMPDGEPAEVFVKLGKQGTAISGLMHAWVVTISAALQRGVPWSELR